LEDRRARLRAPCSASLRSRARRKFREPPFANVWLQIGRGGSYIFVGNDANGMHGVSAPRTNPTCPRGGSLNFRSRLKSDTSRMRTRRESHMRPATARGATYIQSPIEDLRLLGPRPWQILRHDLPKIDLFGHPDPEINIVHDIILVETGGIRHRLQVLENRPARQQARLVLLRSVSHMSNIL